MKHETTRGNGTQPTVQAIACEHASDLVAFLYGEASEAEAHDFQNHLTSCASCSDELASFANVRSGIVSWRDEALNPLVAAASVAVRHRVQTESDTKRSALVALRQYFTLAPIWLKGVTAAAIALFAGLLFLTTIRYFDRAETYVVQAPLAAPKVDDQPQVVQDAKNEVDVPKSNPAASANVASSQRRDLNQTNPGVATRTKSKRHTNAPILSNEERSQLSDLLIAAKEDEEEMPRLYDLLTESN
jgi:hypothetical protein